MSKLEQVKANLAEKKVFLEKELAKVEKAENFLLNSSADVIETLLGSVSKKSRHGLLSIEVSRIVNSFVGTFTVKDVRASIETLDEELVWGESSLSTCLFQLKKRGVIEEVEKGRGSRPALYKKV